MHLCFAIPWRTSWKPFAMFFHMIWTHVWISLFHYSWSYFCVSVHVITWLLSFYCTDYVFYAHVLSSLIPALNAYIDDQDCDGACHLKNYSFVITYLLEDEQELSLGCLIRLKCIYNFWCSMLVLTPFALSFVTLRGIFMHFLELTY
jgi:hypothetical protein